MKFEKTKLEEVLLIEPDVFKDDRGFFFESYQVQKYAKGGIPFLFVQDNHSKSSKNTLRGLHAQVIHPQGKLIRVVQGEIYDVAVDIRKGSPTYKKWVGITLKSDTFQQLYIPPGFAHGFAVMSEDSEVEYKCTDYYDPAGEISIAWNDPELDIDWPIKDPILSKKDSQAKKISELEDRLPQFKAKSAV